MATRSRARHFHATAKALSKAAAMREQDDSLLLTASISDIDISAIVADGGSSLPIDDTTLSLDALQLEHAPSEITSELLVKLHDELRWAESKLMHASERLAEAQVKSRKDLVALAIMRRELLSSFMTERKWLEAATKWMNDVLVGLVSREKELTLLVESGVRTEQVIHELAAVRAERKIFELSLIQNSAQLARIADNEATSEYHVASEAYDCEPDGASMREVARMRSQSNRMRRESAKEQVLLTQSYDELGLVKGVGEITAANAFLVAEYEGDDRAAQRMSTIRNAQMDTELRKLPEPEAAWRSGLRHPVNFMRARRTTR